jgi:hypothetical protein
MRTRSLIKRRRNAKQGDEALRETGVFPSDVRVDDEGGRDGKPAPMASEVLLKERTPVVDDEVTTESFRLRMQRASKLRRDGKSWHREWEAIEQEVFDASRKAAAALADLGVTQVDLHDGYVAEVSLSAAALVDHAHELFQRAPKVQHVRLTGYKPCAERVLALDILPLLRSLGLRGNGIDDEDLVRLVQTPSLSGLYWLDLADNDITERGLFSLAETDCLYQLVYVGLTGNPCASPLDRAVEDGGDVLDADTTELGVRLEAASPGRSLAWVHAPVRFGRLFPPTPADASALAERVLRMTPAR